MRHQRGVTLIELVFVVAIASIAATTAAIYSLPWLARESMRGSANEMASFLQLTKIESVSRNRDCRFVVDTTNRAIEVWDSMGTTVTSDDTRLHRGTIPAAVRFARPDSGDSVTLADLDPPQSFHAVITSDGIVSDGAGAVFIHGGDGYGSVELHAAGGVELRKWNGSSWQVGY